MSRWNSTKPGAPSKKSLRKTPTEKPVHAQVSDYVRIKKIEKFAGEALKPLDLTKFTDPTTSARFSKEELVYKPGRRSRGLIAPVVSYSESADVLTLYTESMTDDLVARLARGLVLIRVGKAPTLPLITKGGRTVALVERLVAISVSCEAGMTISRLNVPGWHVGKYLHSKTLDASKLSL